MNLKMPALKRCLEAAGFTDVKTLLSSGNAAFDAKKTATPVLEQQVKRALTDGLGKTFLTLVRSQDELRALLDADPFAAFTIAKTEKRVVTFLRDEPDAPLALPITKKNGRILTRQGREVFTTYTPSPQGAGFMAVLEQTWGKAQTTRTWDTVRKCAAA